MEVFLRKLTQHAADKLVQAVIEWSKLMEPERNECCQRVWAYHKIARIADVECTEKGKANLVNHSQK